MALTVTIRGSQTEDFASFESVTFVALGGLPNLIGVNDAKATVDGTLSRAPGAIDEHTWRCLPFKVEQNAEHDFADARQIQRVLNLYRYKQLYAVSGGTRSSGTGNDWWAGYGLPIAIELIGDARLAADYAGNDNLEFKTRKQALVYT
jgi:hypothetical protein